jgi:hypothetical protein
MDGTRAEIEAMHAEFRRMQSKAPEHKGFFSSLICRHEPCHVDAHVCMRTRTEAKAKRSSRHVAQHNPHGDCVQEAGELWRRVNEVAGTTTPEPVVAPKAKAKAKAEAKAKAKEKAKAKAKAEAKQPAEKASAKARQKRAADPDGEAHPLTFFITAFILCSSDGGC